MKKIYAAALLAAVAVSANAQNGAPLYATGEKPAFDPAWDPENPVEFKYENGVYTLEPAGNLTSFKISTAKGTWDAFNAGALCAPYNETDMGNPVALAPSDGNIITPWKGIYKIVVAGDLSTITMTTTTPKPVGFTPIFVRGGMNEWGAPEEWQLKTEDGKTYYLNMAEGQSIAAGIEFKLADSEWAKINYGPADAEPAELDVPYTWNYNSGNNCTLAEECTGSVVMVLPDEAQGPAEVTFSNDPYVPAGVSNISVDNNEVAKYYNLQGVRVNDARNGLYIVVKGGKAEKVLVK